MNEYLEYEQTLLSQILLKPDIIDELLITPELFKDNKYREIFLAIERARLKSERIDSVMVYQELLVSHKEYVADFAQISPAFTVQNAKFYCDALTERNIRQGLLLACNDGLENLKDKTKTSLEIAESIEQRIASSVRGKEKTRSPFLKDSVEQIKANFDKKISDRRSGNQRIVTLGINGLDEYMGGVLPKEVIAIGARPSVGKSAMGLQIFLNVCFLANHPSMFISLEMGREEILERMASNANRIPFGGIRSGALTNEQIDIVKNSYDFFSNSPMSILDCSQERLTLTLVKSYIRREKTLRNVEVVIIDYLGLLDVDDGRRARWERMVEITNTLKLLAVELDIVIIELAQLTRLAEGKEPTMADLRDSGSVEQDADGIILLHPQGEYDIMSRRQVKAIVAKRRNGRVGSTLLTFDGNCQYFDEEEKNEKRWPKNDE